MRVIIILIAIVLTAGSCADVDTGDKEIIMQDGDGNWVIVTEADKSSDAQEVNVVPGQSNDGVGASSSTVAIVVMEADVKKELENE